MSAVDRRVLLRPLLGPVGVTAIVVAMSVVTAPATLLGQAAAPFSWLLLGLSAGYALSGSP